MKTNISTDINQSKRLLACGVDPKTADMVWLNRDELEPYLTFNRGCNRAIPEVGDVPAWSLSALLALLPNRVFNLEKRVECGLTWVKRNDDTYSAGYMGLTQRIEPVEPFKTEDKSLFEACVQMIEWLVANGYSLNKTEK